MSDNSRDMRYAVVFTSTDGVDIFLRHATMFNEEPTERDIMDLCFELATEERFGLTEDIEKCDLLVMDREDESMSDFFEWFDAETADGDWEYEEHVGDEDDEVQ